MAASKSTVQLSRPASRTVCGYEIKHMPLGATLDALEALQNLPGELVQICFPGKDLTQALNQLKKLDADMLSGIVANALTAAPRHMVKVLARLLGISEDLLINDPNIGIDGLIEMADAWIDLNGNFTKAARPLVEKIRAMVGSFLRQKTGFSASSPMP